MPLVAASSNLCYHVANNTLPALPWLQLRRQVDDLVMPQDESLRTEATAIAQVGPAQHGQHMLCAGKFASLGLARIVW